MLPYFLLFAILAVGAFMGAANESVRPRLWITGLIVILFVGLRFEVGGDWFVYLRIFTESQGQSLSTMMDVGDPGYMFVNWIGNQLGLKIWFVNSVCAMIFTIGLVSIARLQPNPRLAMLVAFPYLIMVVATGYTRQSAALGFIMLGLAQYVRGSTWKMFISIVLAAAFHKTAVIMIPVIFIGMSRKGVATVLSVCLLALVTYYLFLRGNVDQLMRSYVGNKYNSSGAAVRLAMNFVPAVLYLFHRRAFGFDPKQQRIWLIFSLASIAALAAFFISPSSTAVDRVALYFIPLQVVILSRIPIAYGQHSRRNWLMLCSVVGYSLLIEVVWLTLGSFTFAWVPYRNYLWLPPHTVVHYHRE